MRVVRVLALVAFAVGVCAFVAYVWGIGDDTPPYHWHYPTSTQAGSR
jgi:peptidoglycan/LPS O-acetylase OafA/YrhL